MLQFIADNLELIMVIAVCVAIFQGFPVAFTLAGVALIFAGFGIAAGELRPDFLLNLPTKIFSVITGRVLIAVPLFIFMGVMLEKSKIAEDVLDSMAQLFGAMRGGLGVALVLVGALLAASTGIVGATVVTMGLLALPTMLKHNYAAPLATGAIAASGTLGQIIPPSIVLVLLGDQLSNARSEAGRIRADLLPDATPAEIAALPPLPEVTVGHLFFAALIPGLLLVVLYAAFVVATAVFRPHLAPAMPKSERRAVDLKKLALATLPPIGLIIAVLGSILAGVATPEEAAALGALGAILIAGVRLCGPADDPKRGRLWVVAGIAALVAVILFAGVRQSAGASAGVTDTASLAVAVVLCGLGALGLLIALTRLQRNGCLADVTRSTARITAMVFTILLGAQFFSLVFKGLGGDALVHGLLLNTGGGPYAALAIVMLLIFVLGFFLDFIEITFVVVPFIAPPLIALGLDPVWLGVLIALNLQTSFLTPPFGFALFYLRGVAPPSVTTMQIYRGALPFVGIQLAALIAVAAVPAFATWLPSVLG